MYIKPCISKSYNFILFDSTQYLYYQLLLVLKVQPSRAGAGRIEKLTFNEPSPPPPPRPIDSVSRYWYLRHILWHFLCTKYNLMLCTKCTRGPLVSTRYYRVRPILNKTKNNTSPSRFFLGSAFSLGTLYDFTTVGLILIITAHLPFIQFSKNTK